MARGEVVLMIPSQIDPDGADKLEKELKRHRVKVLARGNLVFAEWGDKTRRAVGRGLSVQAFFTDKISAAQLSRLPLSEQRIGKLWNWSIDHLNRKVSTKQVERLMDQLDLEVKGNKVFDRMANASIGDVEAEEQETVVGNWCMCQKRGYQWLPALDIPVAYWEKLYCWTTAYSGTSCSGASPAMEFVSASVDGPHHYGYGSATGAPMIYAEDWSLIWIWQTRGGKAHSYARKSKGDERELTYTIK